MISQHLEHKQYSPNSFWRYFKGSIWVTLIFWLVSYVLATILDDPFRFLTVPLPVLYGISQILITVCVVPISRIPVWRRLGAAVVSAVLYGFMSGVVIWPMVARMPWGREWTAATPVLLSLGAGWMVGSWITYVLITGRLGPREQ